MWGVFDEFINGDFEMIRNAINALNDSNPGLNLSEDHAETIIGTFAKVREILLSKPTRSPRTRSPGQANSAPWWPLSRTEVRQDSQV